MRAVLLTLILSLGVPGLVSAKKAASPACLTRCETSYELCKSRAVSKSAQKTCKVVRKNCKSGCVGR